MKKPIILLAGLLLAATASANSFHPNVPLLDKDGNRVVDSGAPLSTMTTCGQCHDTDFIASSSDHADAGAHLLGTGGEHRHGWDLGPGYFGGWDPLRYDSIHEADGGIDVATWLKHFGGRHVGGGPAAERVEMDCLLCHADIYDSSARSKALEAGDFAWANAAPLTTRGILGQGEAGWQWNPEAFAEDGSVRRELLDIRKPVNANCGQCHGLVNDSLDQPLTIPPDLDQRVMTDRTGEIFSPQKLSLSGLNLAGKDELAHPFDVHADRVVGCVNCHYSLNNPVYFQRRQDDRPPHLDFDPRRLTSAEYLERPLHQFAKGSSTVGLGALESENSLRRCASCHDADAVHNWLPYKDSHFRSLACESCHIPKVYGPALQSIDWTLVDRNGQPQREYRGIDGDPTAADTLFEGYRPAMLARANVDGKRKLAPFNLISSWYWLTGDPPRPVTRDELIAALYQGDNLHPDLIAALDDNHDDEVGGAELRLDSPDRAEAVRSRLEASGLAQVQLATEIAPFPVDHDVVNGRWATRDCSECHGADSVLAAPFTLASYRPGGMLPHDGRYPEVDLNGEVIELAGGGAAYVAPKGAEGFYILGLDNVPLVDLAGVLMVLGITLGVSVHAIARYLAWRRRPPQHHATRPVHLYSAYDRIWHWLQALAILLLLFTGLIIHKPHIFGMFSFAYVVQVHNVLGFILLINAALALFYNLASGAITRFLPEFSNDYFVQAIAQARYYTKGIFAGEPHPLQKTAEHRLNPLQQVTYFAILNILLPAQVITGVIIWGMQRWPQIAASLGGLPVLAPIHTLVAWAFAAFIIMHVYLTTTGETPLSGIKAMISGWEDVEVHDATATVTPQNASKEPSHV